MNPRYISVPCSHTMFDVYKTVCDGKRTLKKETSSQPTQETSVFSRKWGRLSGVDAVWKYGMFYGCLFCTGLTASSDAHFKWELILETRAVTWT